MEVIILNKYIILLRGINISGKNKISMDELKQELENHNYQNVITYLNSGNIILSSDKEKEFIMNDIHLIIKKRFNLDIPVYVISSLELKDILVHNPEWWGTNNKAIYDNIIFVIPPMTCEEVYSTVGEPKESIDMIQEYNNIIFWSYDLNNYRKSNWWIKTTSTSIRNQITIRTANTIKKILELCNG